jgi:predicted phage terminase large subunit-like protein
MHELSDGKLYMPPHLQRLNGLLYDLAFGKIKRLMITMPPRHGKSEMSSHYLPVWYLGIFPYRRVMLASYEAGFAEGWGRKARDSYNEAVFRGLFSHKIRPDMNAAKRWELPTGGGMHTAGVGGSLTGRGGDLLIIDDPVKNAEEALSSTYREKAWDWYLTTFRTRREPGASELMILTRWHLDDLAGRALQDTEEPWTVLNFPALAEEDDALGRKPGEALWPERYSEEDLQNTKAMTGSHWWNAMYQQRPVEREGGMFKTDWFEIVSHGAAGPNVRRVRYWDRAASAKGDWTVGALVATDGSTYWIEDIVRFRGSSAVNEQRILQTAQMDGQAVRIYMETEGGSSGPDANLSYSRLLSGFAFRGDRPKLSKELRADPFAAQCENGNVKLVRAEWNRDYIGELASFPMGLHDDQVDASSGAFNQLTGRPAQRTMAKPPGA